MVVTKGTRKQGNGIGGMSHRTAAWLAWSLWAVCVALIGLALVLDFLTGDYPYPTSTIRSANGLVGLPGILLGYGAEKLEADSQKLTPLLA